MIRAVRESDVALLQAICRETYEDTFGPSISAADIAVYMDEAYSEATLLAELANPESFYYFLYQEDQVVGYLKLNVGQAQTEQVADGAMEIQRIYIRPAYKRQGLGSQLMAHALSIAQEKGVPSIWLGVWEYNHVAQAFYKEHGFVKVGEHIFQTGDQKDIDHILLKELKKD